MICLLSNIWNDDMWVTVYNLALNPVLCGRSGGRDSEAAPKVSGVLKCCEGQ